jgi:anti-sigma regulatory factor (Ser/Thr protein kinase)
VSEARASGEHPGSARADQSPSGSPELDLTLAADVESLPALRRSVAGWLKPRGLGESDLSSVQVVLSELVANAIEASQAGDEVGVRLACAGPTLTVEVRNRSRRQEPVPIPTMADPLAPRGRGLAIVGSLTDQLSLRELDGHTVAQGVLRLDAGGADA